MFLKRRSYFERAQKILYLPIEIHSREFHSKLYLARQASMLGWTVLLGPKYDVNLLAQYLPAGAYLGIGFHRAAATIGNKLKFCGHKIVSQDEEGLVRLAPELYSEYRVAEQIEGVSDYLLCWGDEHKNIVASIFPDSKKVNAVGNTRIDLLDGKSQNIFHDDVSELKKRYGNFILINGNFGSANHVSGAEYFMSELKDRGWLATPDKKRYHLDRITFQRKIFHEMMDLTIEIAKEGRMVIVRPHPSENIQVWEDYTKDYRDHVKIIRSGNVLAWLLASELVVHNGCTTAIEARLLGKTVISYRPYKDPLVESHLPNAVSINLETQVEVIDFLKTYTEQKMSKASIDIINSNITANFQEQDSASRILKLLDSLTICKPALSGVTLKNNLTIEVVRLKKLLSQIIYRKNDHYENFKCPGLDVTEVMSVLASMDKFKGCCNDIDVFSLTKKSIVLAPKR